jgi:hypothetical protein
MDVTNIQLMKTDHLVYQVHFSDSSAVMTEPVPSE